MKKAIVVGATSGIGREIAKILAADGYRVGITGRRTELLNELKNQNPDHFLIRSFDIRETEQTIKCLEELSNKLDGLDLLVISSGTGELNEGLDFKLELPALETNVIGFTNVADWTYNYFTKQKFGHLIGITSIGGLRGGRGAPAYNASKAFQINYLEGLMQKTCKIKLPISVTDIRAGLVDTDMAKGEGLFWVAPVEKAAKQIYIAIKRKKKIAYITRRWGIAAFIIKLMPRAIYNRM